MTPPTRNFYVVASEHDTANWLERVAIFELKYIGSIESAEKLFMSEE